MIEYNQNIKQKGVIVMKEKVTEGKFISVMNKHGFSYEGAKLLFEYLTMLEEDIGTDFEFDPVRFRCDFVEYPSVEAALEDLGCSMEVLEENIIARGDNCIIVNYCW